MKARSLGLALLGLVALDANATSVVFNDFSDISGLTLNGSTASIGNPVDGNVLRLTNDLGQGGSAFSTNTISLANLASFSSAFSFRISNPGGISDEDGQGADGLVFVVQTVANNVGGSGGGIGYMGLNNSVGIEFDTWNNGGFDDNNGNHIGIDVGGNIDSETQTSVATRMNNGAVWYSWVDYNGETGLLEVRFSGTNARPANALLSHTLNLVDVLGQTDAYVGFTSGTGGASGWHDILSWEFRDDFDPIGVPEPMSALLLGLGLFGLRRARR